MKTTEKASLFSKIITGTMFAFIVLGLSAVTFVVYHLGDMSYQLDKVTVASISNPSKPTPASAYEGYGETCVLEVWNYPSQYNGIQEWKDHNPNNAKASNIIAAPYSSECDKNFNPLNPEVPFKGKDYGNNYNIRAEHLYFADRA